MKTKNCVSVWVLTRMIAAAGIAGLAACSGMRGDDDVMYADMATPTVDYVESLDVYSAPHKDSFLNQLAMNYRSYAIYNARTSGYPDVGELFAQKAVAAFSGELPFPETLENWNIQDEQTSFEIHTAYNNLMEQLKSDVSDTRPDLAAEAQAKFDCWISAVASGQTATANQCRTRFNKALQALRECSNGKVVSNNGNKQQMSTTTSTTTVTQSQVAVQQPAAATAQAQTYYPETRNYSAMNGAGRTREGVIIVNNVNVPENLINPVPVQSVQPMVFNQNIYGGDRTVSNSGNNNSWTKECARAAESGAQPAAECSRTTGEVQWQAQGETPTGTQWQSEGETQWRSQSPDAAQQYQQIPMLGEELVTRDEFINMMMAMRAELAAINARLDKLQDSVGEKTTIKVQQIPLEPKQHVMEEVFEVLFDFDKATIKPEYQELIQQLAAATQANRNIKVSVVGHTDTVGGKDYNYALGGRRADAVQKMLIKYGIPASQIVAVSAGKEGLAVPTPDNTPNAANRRVRVVKEVHYTEDAPSGTPVAIEIGTAGGTCGEYGCEN